MCVIVVVGSHMWSVTKMRSSISSFVQRRIIVIAGIPGKGFFCRSKSTRTLADSGSELLYVPGKYSSSLNIN